MLTAMLCNGYPEFVCLHTDGVPEKINKILKKEAMAVFSYLIAHPNVSISINSIAKEIFNQRINAIKPVNVSQVSRGLAEIRLLMGDKLSSGAQIWKVSLSVNSIEFAVLEKRNKSEVMFLPVDDFKVEYMDFNEYTDFIQSANYSNAKPLRSDVVGSRDVGKYDFPDCERFFRIGNIRIPIINLFGTPRQVITPDDLIIKYDPVLFHEKNGYPIELKKTYKYFIEKYLNKVGYQYKDNILPRLSKYIQHGEGQNDERGKIELFFQQTTFYHFLATSRSLDIYPDDENMSEILGGKTLRQYFLRNNYSIEGSVLANTLGVDSVVISHNFDQGNIRKLVMKKRSGQVALYRNCFQSASSGFVALSHIDKENMPNPFTTSIIESEKEVADSFMIEANHYKMIGMAVNWNDLDLNVYGYIETEKPVTQLLSDYRRDGYEGPLLSLDFLPSVVLKHICENQWEPISAFSTISALCAFYGRQEVERECRKCPVRNIDWFEEVE